MTDHDHEPNDTLTDLVRQIVTEQAAEGWDLPPVLALVFAHRVSEDSHDAILEVRGLQTGDLFTHGLDPLIVVRAAAMAISMAPVGSSLPFEWPVSAEFIGAMLIVESWAVSGHHSDDPEAFARLRAWVEDGNNLADHPDAYEAKCATLVTNEGDVAAATYRRTTGDTTADVVPWSEELGGLPSAVALVTAVSDERHDAEREAASRA